jgi:ubiquinone biosynthesis protein
MEVLGEELPGGLRHILHQWQRGRFEVQIEHERLNPSLNRLVAGLLTSALFIGSSLLWAFKAEPLIGSVPLLGALGYLLTAGLGIRLLWAIRRSGNLERRP